MSAERNQEVGYTWAGSLAAVKLPTLYRRLASLRLSGRLFLSSAGHTAIVEFIGGEAVHFTGPDRVDPMLHGEWSVGDFRVLQALPDLRGDLTDGRELEGALAISRPRALIRHCEDTRLTAELFLTSVGGEQARIRFAHGRLESTEVNGAPELAALGRVEQWDSGGYRLVLRPLFAEDAPPPPPTMKPPKEVTSDGFDVTGGVPLADLRAHDRAELTPTPLPFPPRSKIQYSQPAALHPHAGSPPNTPSSPRPPSGMRAIASTPPAIAPVPPPLRREHEPVYVDPEDSTGERPMVSESTALTRGDSPSSSASSSSSSIDDDQDADLRGTSLGTKLGIAGGLMLLLAVAGAILYLTTRPQPIATVLAAPDAALAPENAQPRPDAAVATRPSTAPVEPAHPSGTTDAHVNPDRTSPVRADAVDKLVSKGLKLLVAGHSHTALDLFKKAQKLAPRDETVAAYAKMALGKTGKGELILDGKGLVIVGGQSIKSPKKLKLPAGTYPIGIGGVPSEVVVSKGKKVHVRAK